MGVSPAPMPSPDSDEPSAREMAAATASRLLSRVDVVSAQIASGIDPEELETTQLDEVDTAPTVFLADVDAAADAFAHQLGALRWLDLPQPCVELPEGPVPLDLGTFFPTPLLSPRVLRYGYPLREALYWLIGSYEELGNRLSRRRERPEISIRPYSVEAAREFFGTRLHSFLGARFSVDQANEARTQRDTEAGGGRYRDEDNEASGGTAGTGGAPPSPGLRFRVTTDSTGLRIHYSLTLLFNMKNVLSAPTTPVDGWIHPGRYVFGAARPGSMPQFDLTAEYDVPPHRSAHLAM